MIIEFPKTYKVTPVPNRRGNIILDVEVPKDSTVAARIVFRMQDWVREVGTSPSGAITVYVSGAYEVTEAQAVEALERLCAFVILTPVGKETDDAD